MGRFATFVLLVLVGSVTSGSTAAAEEANRAVGRHSGKALQILTVDTPPVLDGKLDDAAWTTADRANGFVQRDPDEGAPATEATEVRVVTDGTNLYFGVRCSDRDPSGILARELRRDDELATDDTFAIILDTFHDHRNGFVFRINPAGAQFDAMITDEGRTVNATWSEEWLVETRVADTGWTAEIRIPLRAMRFAASDLRPAFGIDFERVIRRKNEQTYWNSYSRNYDFNQLSQGGHLVGVERLTASSRTRFKPYVNSSVFARGTGQHATKLGGEAGVEDLKYTLTPGLTFDLTVNTDFAQAEVDDQIANFERVPVFFPEKRDFFLEGAGLFEFGVARGEGDEVKLYHSRRIGLSDEGRAIPIVGGAKLAGKVGEKYTVGLLDVQTDRQGGRAGSNFGVFRLRRNVLSRSSVGVFATNRQAGGPDFNRVAGLDANFVVLRHLTLRAVGGRSSTGGVTRGQSFGWTGWEWNDDLIVSGFDYYRLGENFRSDVGFLERTGVVKYSPHFTISPRPKTGRVRQYGFGLRVDHFRRLSDGELEAETYHGAANIRFQDGSNIRITPHHRRENLLRPFKLPGGLLVPPGRYSWFYFPNTYSFNPAWKLTGSVQYRIEPGYFGPGGLRQTWNVNPIVRLSQNVSAKIDYSLNRVQLPHGTPVNVHVVNTRMDVSFNREWLTSTTFQYSNTRDLVGVNFRLRYRYGPNHDLFVVVNSVGSDPDPLRQVDRSVTIKLTRSFDF